MQWCYAYMALGVFQASIVNLFIPEGMLEPIPAVINWKAAVHLGKVSSFERKSEPKLSEKKRSKGGSCPQNGPNCPISILLHH